MNTTQSQNSTANAGGHTPHSPLVNLDAKMPEWSVVGVPYEGADQYLDKINVYQNGALVAVATADEPTYDALCELVKHANQAPAMLEVLRAAIDWADSVPAPYREWGFIAQARAIIAAVEGKQ